MTIIGNEIDLLKNYPKAKRNLSQRAEQKTKNDREIAREFGQDFFDGNRKHGYGGFHYFPKFWKPVIPTFIEYWNLKNSSSFLDIGCAKGFMLYDLKLALPGINISGIDISEYAIANSIESIKPFLKVCDAKSLPFDNNDFDVVVSINTIHNLEEEECAMALQEIERVSKGSSFITVDAFRNDEEKSRMEDWNLTAKTIKSVDDWKSFFLKVGYTGDYYWFIP